MADVPAPLTEAALAEIEARAAKEADIWGITPPSDVMALLAEVRRLREALAGLIKGCVLSYSTPPAPPGDWMDWQECFLCDEISRQSAPHHKDDCPVPEALAALTADGAALAAAITALVDSRGSTEELCRRVDELRAEWRGA